MPGSVGAQDRLEGGGALPDALRRGASAAERIPVSNPENLGHALAGVWQWGQFRIVVAEDLMNCMPTGHCPFAVLDRAGVVIFRGMALERPEINGPALVWTEPDGRIIRAHPAP